ncbi:hypothetical protein DV737_g4846, partial [Chaetothyriales sp. CBS 132003]
MKSFVNSALMLLASLTAASPLEHLENIFYKTALIQFSASDFEAFGLPSSYFSDLLFIALDEQSHVDLLTTAIAAAGSTPVAPCSYNFPFTDVQSFLTLSSVLEGVGTSAYLGAAPLVTDKTILTTAASIMVTEALHTSQQRAVVQQVPASNPLGTPLGANSAFTLAASFILSCPSGNPSLPFTAFPSLAIDTSSCSSASSSGYDHDSSSGKSKNSDNSNSTYSYSSSSRHRHRRGSKNQSSSSSLSPPPSCFVTETITIIASVSIPSDIEVTSLFVTFISGLTVVSVEILTATDVTGSNPSLTAVIPPAIEGGQTYIFVTNKDISGGTLVDQDIVMGPGITEITAGTPFIDPEVVIKRSELVVGVSIP